MTRLLALVAVSMLLTACASQPSNVNDACAIYDEKGGLFNNWYRYSKSVEKEFGVPPHITMATIWKESTFQARVKPPRKRYLGFIPGPRPSDAYGYPQALKSTWKWYREETGRSRAKRNKFKHAIHFVGWYHDQSYRKNKVSKTDAYNLYLNYYLGHGGYARGAAAGNPHAREAAGRVAAQAEKYRVQLSKCRR
ncbi:hypothetical protein [Alcanivorax sp. 1008]|uniref:transglycosylase SLT domain-containing protein n=1 Tax=Alcanivorax sp. 1008 TaxID=2816853 RepID=UPI001E1296BE|nr:hypothetical protein [Alcanivorax sp. 1008]MCC1497922.1 hypothetical protein [Alcanivorax sp. 1008]